MPMTQILMTKIPTTQMLIKKILKAGSLFVASVGSLSLLALPAAQAQGYPTKPVKFVTPFSAGSGPDVALRTLADKMSKDLGQPVVIENKPGGND